MKSRTLFHPFLWGALFSFLFLATVFVGLYVYYYQKVESAAVHVSSDVLVYSEGKYSEWKDLAQGVDGISAISEQFSLDRVQEVFSDLPVETILSVIAYEHEEKDMFAFGVKNSEEIEQNMLRFKKVSSDFSYVVQGGYVYFSFTSDDFSFLSRTEDNLLSSSFFRKSYRSFRDSDSIVLFVNGVSDRFELDTFSSSLFEAPFVVALDFDVVQKSVDFELMHFDIPEYSDFADVDITRYVPRGTRVSLQVFHGVYSEISLFSDSIVDGLDDVVSLLTNYFSGRFSFFLMSDSEYGLVYHLQEGEMASKQADIERFIQDRYSVQYPRQEETVLSDGSVARELFPSEKELRYSQDDETLFMLPYVDVEDERQYIGDVGVYRFDGEYLLFASSLLVAEKMNAQQDALQLRQIDSLEVAEYAFVNDSSLLSGMGLSQLKMYSYKDGRMAGRVTFE